MLRFAWVAGWWGLAGCAEPECPVGAPADDPDQPNVLVVIIDDVGIDQYAAWDANPDPVPAPTMDCLCSAGLRFDTVWASPFCTPARAALLTGMHPRRDGVGRFIDVNKSTWELPLVRRTMAEALSEVGYATAFFGKWHLGSKAGLTGLRHPNAQGFRHFSGTLGNPRTPEGRVGREAYFGWEQLEDGELTERHGYMTSETVDDALRYVDDMPEPWFVVVSFNAAHVPLHQPPGRLYGGHVSRKAEDAQLHRAMVESVDTELGRLFERLDPDVLGRTQIWTMSDNGTVEAGRPADQPANRHKGTLYEAGVRIPMVVSGAGVPARGEATAALVSILDVFPTVVEQAGGEVGEVDGLGLRHLLDDPGDEHHEYLYADVSSADGEVSRAVRNREQKLVVRADGTRETWRLRERLEEEPVPFDNPALRQALADFVAVYSPNADDPDTQ